MVSVNVPGVDKSSLKVEMHDEQLFIFQLLHQEEGIDIPYMVASLEVSDKVNKREIRSQMLDRMKTKIRINAKTATGNRV